MDKKRYIAAEMREAASVCETVEVADQFYSVEMDRAAEMLRQAADTEEENAQLKARLATVVKECENKVRETSCDDCRDAINGLGGKKLRCNDWPMCTRQEKHIFFDAILRAARGEGGAE